MNKTNKTAAVISRLEKITFLWGPTCFRDWNRKVIWVVSCEKSIETVLTRALKSHTKTETIFAILMLLSCLYLKGNVKATYLSIEANNKEINETKRVIGVI